jgi:peptidoglycan hydrolase-like protein with peptidoglycan-binding domain
MGQLLGKRNLGGLFLAAVTAGALSVPAVSAQTSSSAQPKKVVHKTHTDSSTATTHASASSSHKTSSKKKSRVKKVKGQAVPTPERITEIQEALAKKGVYSGSTTGQWDDPTTEAMKKFQTANGLTPSGKLDALTLQKLGFGSETAGLAAPTPPPNSTNRLRNLSSLPPDPTEPPNP